MKIRYMKGQFNPIGSVYGATNLGVSAATGKTAIDVVNKGAKKAFGKRKGKKRKKKMVRA